VRRIPLLGVGGGYVRCGPLWRLRDKEPDVEVFRQAIRALHNEFVCRRGLALRLYPHIFTDDSLGLGKILTEEGFTLVDEERQERTILMDVTPSIEELRNGMLPHWKRELKVAEKNQLDIVEGCGDDLFERFLVMYDELIARKNFIENVAPLDFRRIQAHLPEEFKMRIVLGSSSQGLCAGLIYSQMGDTVIYLFGATSNLGLKSRGSYLLQWHTVGSIKERGAKIYNLNGINPEKNPGTYNFKRDIAGTHGRDVYYLGRFDAAPGLMNSLLLQLADGLKKRRREWKQYRISRRSTQETKPN